MASPIFARRHYVAVAGVILGADYIDPETRGRLVSDSPSSSQPTTSASGLTCSVTRRATSSPSAIGSRAAATAAATPRPPGSRRRMRARRD
jgi:hypothetical protein